MLGNLLLSFGVYIFVRRLYKTIKLKIIALHLEQSQLIKKALKQNREAQAQLFDHFSPKMLGVCRQYVKDNHHAEDLLLSGFMKVFSNLKQFKNEGSLEGWIRKIMVNTCISYLRKKTTIDYTDEDYILDTNFSDSFENTSEKDIQKIIDQLPNGYKMVFNLYAIEGYKHSEIAKMLQISESTSKSQLFKARKLLQAQYQTINSTIYENN